MYDNVDLFDLERFVKAQDTYDSYNIALKEIKDGWKQSHWMWYVFPQIHGLGHSSMSQKFSIKSLLEALAYLRHDTLGERLYEVMNALPVHGDANLRRFSGELFQQGALSENPSDCVIRVVLL